MSTPLDPKIKAVNAAQKVLDTVVKKLDTAKGNVVALTAEKATATAALKAAKDAAKAAPKK